jgi:glycosyltransferase involved in cell wall biosynthesis
MMISLIITTYNRPDSLKAVLSALNAQNQRDFEVLIADDGSTDDTRLMLHHFEADFPLHHVWQHDQGFRAARIRNRALRQAQGDYIIFIDGDCIPRRDFIARHCALAEKNCFVSGQRILCQPAFTEHVLHQHIPLWQWSLWQWLRAYQRGHINRLLPLLALPDGAWRQRASVQHWRGVKTCNLGVWHSALSAINGFDEAYQGWGHEDADLAVRLLHAGQQRKDGRFSVAVFHLWHPEAPRTHEADNIQRLHEALAQKRTHRAQQGMMSP